MQKTLFILLLTIFCWCCRKESITIETTIETIMDRCDSLKNGITTNDIRKVKPVVTNFIAGLPSRDYNITNIDTLSRRISSGCGVTVQLICFDCIRTLPSQTEIRISVDSAGVIKKKIIDLSYTPANEIVFRNMHD